MKLSTPFVHLKSALSGDQISHLRKIYREYIPTSGIPCYAFLERQNDKTFQAIQSLVQESIGQTPHYLNDFFFYTDTSFATPWHVDTELYVFKFAINAWILLEPDQIDNPLAIISKANNPNQPFFHSVEREDDSYIFVDYSNGTIDEHLVSEIEESHISTPEIQIGDILLFDPQRFHRTNTTKPKGACVFKFIYSDEDSLLRKDQVPGIMWPEVALYNELVSNSEDWPAVLSRIKEEINIKSIESPLVSGFYPDHFTHLAQKASALKS